MPITRYDPEGDNRVPGRSCGHGAGDVLAEARQLLGWDPVETKIIESNEPFYSTIVARVERSGRLIPAEKVLGPLDD